MARRCILGDRAAILAAAFRSLERYVLTARNSGFRHTLVLDTKLLHERIQGDALTEPARSDGQARSASPSRLVDDG